MKPIARHEMEFNAERKSYLFTGMRLKNKDDILLILFPDDLPTFTTGTPCVFVKTVWDQVDADKDL